MTKNNNLNNFSKYSEEKVKKGVELALKLFIYNDLYLIQNDLHEMAITHRLAIYLGYVFSDCDVDCEWNRNEFEQKKIIDKIKKMLKSGEEIDKFKKRSIRPDIIIHHRGKPNNYIVIEVKKENANDFTNEKEQDLKKLKAMTENDLNYKYGFFIEIPKNEKKSENIQIKTSEFLSTNFEKNDNIFEVTFNNKC